MRYSNAAQLSGKQNLWKQSLLNGLARKNILSKRWIVVLLLNILKFIGYNDEFDKLLVINRKFRLEIKMLALHMIRNNICYSLLLRIVEYASGPSFKSISHSSLKQQRKIKPSTKSTRKRVRGKHLLNGN